MVQRQYRSVITAKPADALPGGVGHFLMGLAAPLVWPTLWVSFGLLLLVPTVAFLLLAFSPAAFDQGNAWLTIDSFVEALKGPTLRGLLNSLVVGVATSALALAFGTALAWFMQRTTLFGKGLWTILIWALMLSPSYLAAVGWENLVEPSGVLSQFGIDATGIHDIIFGPIGVTWVLATRGVPFAYLAMAAGLLGIGRELEDAARVHGAARWESLRITLTVLMPAMWSAVAIVFAESISDFGVASTLAANAHFPVATYTLYMAIDSMPIQFPVASAVGWFLVASAGLALFVQNRALKGRSFAVLSGRTRPAAPQHLTATEQAVALFAVVVFFGAALGVPIVGAITASLLKDFGAHFTIANLTLDNYRRALTSEDLIGPMVLSARLATIVATLAVILGAFIGQLLSRRQVGFWARSLDLLLLGAVALPSTVLAAGYIFAYNLPILGTLGITLYGTLFLMGMAYLAAALPGTSRLLIGPLAQMQRSLVDAARVHGASEGYAVLTTVVPLMARSLIWAWLLTFSGTFLELPISQILFPPGQEPLAVGIIKHLQNYDFAGGSAMMILAVLGIIVVVGILLGGFRLFGPTGWQRMKTR